MDFAERNLLSGIWSKSFGNFDSWMGMVIATNAVKTEEEILEIFSFGVGSLLVANFNWSFTFYSNSELDSLQKHCWCVNIMQIR